MIFERNYANLHTHSTHSDGRYSPQELVRIAKEEGYGALAITDHDTASAFPKLRDECRAEGLDFLFGVEFSVVSPKAYHILGFNFDPEYPEMKEYLAKMALRQTENTRCCFEEARALGKITGISWCDVLAFNEGIPWLCNNHVFNTLLARGLVQQCNYMAWFEENFLHQRGKYPPLYDFLSLPDLVTLIKKAGGIALVAHPHGQLDDIDFLMENGIVGLEVHHPDLTPEEQERAYSIALQKDLFIAGGSDHSGLCGGYYDSYPDEEALRASCHFIEPLSAGTAKHYFDELKQSKLMR